MHAFVLLAAILSSVLAGHHENEGIKKDIKGRTGRTLPITFVAESLLQYGLRRDTNKCMLRFVCTIGSNPGMFGTFGDSLASWIGYTYDPVTFTVSPLPNVQQRINETLGLSPTTTSTQSPFGFVLPRSDPDANETMNSSSEVSREAKSLPAALGNQSINLTTVFPTWNQVFPQQSPYQVVTSPAGPLVLLAVVPGWSDFFPRDRILAGPKANWFPDPSPNSTNGLPETEFRTYLPAFLVFNAAFIKGLNGGDTACSQAFPKCGLTMTELVFYSDVVFNAPAARTTP